MLFYLFARNHILVNGNKRLACLCLSFFCFKQGHQLLIPDDIFYKLAKDTVLADEVNKKKTIRMIEKVIRKYLVKWKYKPL